MTDAVLANATNRTRHFYVGMGLACLAVSVFGFVPTFFIPLARGTLRGPPIYYIHAALFLAWLIYFITQTWLAANDRLIAHREWGVLGAALAAGMVFSVFATLVVMLNRVPVPPAGAPGSPGFLWADVWTILFFAVCVAAALANTRRPERHKRLLLLGMIPLLFPPLGRWVAVWAPGLLRSPPTPLSPAQIAIVLVLSFVPAFLIVIAMAFDRKARKRISRIYVIGLLAYVILVLTQIAVGKTPMWLSIADAMKHIPG
jgi:hypothetical protein